MKTDRSAGAVLMGVGAAVALEASTFDVLFLTDPVGPKAMPYLVAALLVGTGLALALRPGPDPPWPDRKTLIRMGGAS